MNENVVNLVVVFNAGYRKWRERSSTKRGEHPNRMFWLFPIEIPVDVDTTPLKPEESEVPSTVDTTTHQETENNSDEFTEWSA